MPFTPSHAVVALAFLRTPLVPAAVAVGAMTPDLPLFLRVPGLPRYDMTHDPVWLPLTVAVAFALLVLWRCVLRPAARELSPAWLAARLPGEWDAGARAGWAETAPRSGVRLGWLVLSLVLGVLSHIGWDLFTHEGRWGVEALPVLERQWGALTGYKWLQHASSFVGLAIVGLWMIVWLVRRVGRDVVDRVLPAGARVAWWMSLPVVLLCAWLYGLAVHGPLDATFTVAHLAYLVLPQACALWAAGTVVLALTVQWRRAAARR